MDKFPLTIKQLELGPMENYIYIIGNETTKECLIVDPAWDVPAIKQAVGDMKITGALITHGHPDHTNGIKTLLESEDIPIYVSKEEASFYKPIGESIVDVDPSQDIQLGDISVRCLHTPGHTPGSQCFFITTPKRTYSAANNIALNAEHLLISGDTLFLDGCGRCDLPGGNAEIMYNTLANILMKLPNDTIIFPGHNYHHYCCDSLESQKQTNPYLQAENLNKFISRRMPQK